MAGRNLVLYHASCADGFTAAWAAWCALGDKDTEYRHIQHGKPMPDDVGEFDRLYILDFSFKAHVFHTLLAEPVDEQPANVIILDHHRSAELELAEFVEDPPKGWHIEFDMGRSGAMMTWEHFHKEPAPKLVQYVQDRDLWFWELDHSEEINTVIQATPFDFEQWDGLHTMLESSFDGFMMVAAQGSAMLKYAESKQAQILRNHGWTRLEGHLVPCCNDGNWQSELGNAMCKEHPFAVIWFMNDKGEFIWSLRSDKDRPDEVVDVSEIARLYGGGGHKHAAGFRASAPPAMVPGPKEEDDG